MRELIRTIRVIGLRRLWALRRALKWGWEGVIRGHCMTRALQAALQVGLLEAMRRDGSVDARVFAAERGLDAEVLTALCDYLYARRVLRRKDGRFSLDEQGQFLVQTDLMRGWLKLVDGYEPVLHALGPLAEGTVSYGNGVRRDPEMVAVGSGLASEGLYFPLVADIVKRHGWATVLDIGCGDGTFLRSLCHALPNVKAIGIDLSAEAIARGCATTRAQGLSHRIRLFQGDALEIGQNGVIAGEIDAATTFFVLHELVSANGDGELPSFLRRFRDAYPRATLIIVETIRPDATALRRHPGPAIEYFLLHDLSKQVPLNRAKWQSQLRDAGFTSIEERNLSFARSAIYVAH